ncbi:MAG: SDR family NAD(P)-dependent oxidoreductase [Pseudomonadales bacterium]|nr:SDR family NAD(P)-dependent oxidoreductase [Pseudomonadales bacterium]NIX09469.1 SDR family NAD(P)-dependent oxidoreductase [Pseudomonadales bacterium]
MSGNFSGSVVVVTGAAGALGRAVVEHFAACGATVAQLDVVSIDNAHFSETCDLTDPGSCRQAVTLIIETLGRIDVLANIAGGFTMGEAVHETSEETWDFMMGLNARSVLNMARAVVPAMLQQGQGKIVNVGAGAGLAGIANMGAYSASKSVVIRLTEAMSAELKESGINVNCVLPSIIDTERNRADMPDADFDRWVKPSAMAEVIGFLASLAADPIHGAAVPVSGLS